MPSTEETNSIGWVRRASNQSNGGAAWALLSTELQTPYDLPIWAGSIPLSIVAGAAEPDPRLADGVDIPDSVRRFTDGG